MVEPPVTLERRRTPRMALLVLFAALLVQSRTARSEVPLSQYVQTEVTVRNGLPQNSVSSIAQTRDGYLWLGTEEGFVRFDGVRMATFSTLNSKGLKDNFTQALAASPDGSLWIGTRGELTRLQNGQFQTFLTTDNPIYAVFAAKNGTIWTGTKDHLYSVTYGHVRLYTAPEIPNITDIRDIVETADGCIWFASAQGLLRLEQGRFTLFTTHDGLRDNTILRIAPAKDGSLWVATRDRVVRWNGKLLEDYSLKQFPMGARVSTLIVDHKGALWLGFEHNGIARLGNQARSPAMFVRYQHQDGLPADDVAKIFEDHAGNIWVGLAEGGAVQLREGAFQNLGQKEGLSENIIWSVLQARDGSLWVGTNGTGLNHVLTNGKVRVYSTRDGLPSGSVNGLLEDSDGSIWIGLENGFLGHLDHDRIITYRDPASKDARIASILKDSQGDIWLAFHEISGLVRFKGGHFEHFPAPGLLNAAAFAPDHSLWLASDHGGVTQFIDGKNINFTAANGLLSNFAQAIYVDKEGVVWVGTSPGGLNRIKNGRITKYSVAQGLYDLTVGAIIEDDYGNLWMTCNRGIFRVRKSELNDFADGKIPAIHSVVYGTADGLRSAECNFGATPAVWRGQNGRLFFATMEGVASTDPGLSEIPPSPPAVTIENVLANQKPVAYERGVTTGPGSTDLEVQFTVPEFVSPERIQFRYRLRGLDSGWVNAEQRRQAFYTRLTPGAYQFEVQASRGEGVWGPSSNTISISIKPYFWQTNWFRVGCGLILILCVFASHRLRTRYLVRRNLELEHRVDQRTRQLQTATKAAEDAQAALKEQATRDGLTKLWNRRSIFEILDREIDRCRREEASICVIMADLDHFKHINDSLGHQGGDYVLETVSRSLSDLMRPYDSIGRYGGEEFLIILPGCSLESALKRAEEFRTVIQGLSIRFRSKTLTVTCSFGLAGSAEVRDGEGLVATADAALYAAKHAGRNRVQLPS